MGIWDDDSEPEYKIISEGDYIVQLDDLDLDETKIDPKIKLEFRIADNSQFKGRKVWKSLLFKDTTRKFTRWQLDVMDGMDQEKKPSTYQEAARQSLEILGKRIGNQYLATISHNEYNGKTYADLVLKDKYLMGTQAAKKEKMQEPAFDPNEEIPF